MVGAMQKNAEGAASRMQNGVEESARGLELMEEVSGMFGTILDAAQQVAGQVEEISAATEHVSRNPAGNGLHSRVLQLCQPNRKQDAAGLCFYPRTARFDGGSTSLLRVLERYGCNVEGGAAEV